MADPRTDARRRRPRQRVQSENQSPSELRAEMYRSGISEEVLADLEIHVNRRRSFVAGDPYATAFREGERSLYLMIVNLISNDRPQPQEPD